MARLRGVIYDLDGTLVDSRADLADSVNAMLQRMGLPVRDDREVWSFVGEGAERLIRRSLGAHEERYAEVLAKTRLYPGIEAILESPPPLRAVLTNKPGGFARQILRGLGVDQTFRAVLGGDDAPRKPAPDGLLRLCALLGIAPDETLMVGDSSVDLSTGKAAGVATCAVGWGLGEPASLTSADHFCASPADLSALLVRLYT